ncbi:MAG TPA: hypothetical protein VH601_09140 [Bryobacteraceae bacterium]|jgi:hypothetical protein
MQEAESGFAKLEAGFEALRKAVEERDYPALELLLQNQRDLLSRLHISHPRTQDLSRKGSELVSWALTVLKIQRAGYARDLAVVLNANRLFSQYAGASAAEREHVSINA